MSGYPDSDWPYSFFLNGHELPKWSSQWHLCELGDFLNDFEDDWDEFIGYKHIWHLQCRLNHVGVIESEDPLILRICAQEVLLKVVTHSVDVLARIETSAPAGSSPVEIFEGITEGIGRMILIADHDGFAIWTSGYEADQERLKNYISEVRIAAPSQDAIGLPHISERREELFLRSRFQINDLRILAEKGALGKRLRTIVNQLPNRTEQHEGGKASPATS